MTAFAVLLLVAVVWWKMADALSMLNAINTNLRFILTHLRKTSEAPTTHQSDSLR